MACWFVKHCRMTKLLRREGWLMASIAFCSKITLVYVLYFNHKTTRKHIFMWHNKITLQSNTTNLQREWSKNFLAHSHRWWNLICRTRASRYVYRRLNTPLVVSTKESSPLTSTQAALSWDTDKTLSRWLTTLCNNTVNSMNYWVRFASYGQLDCESVHLPPSLRRSLPCVFQPRLAVSCFPLPHVSFRSLWWGVCFPKREEDLITARV